MAELKIAQLLKTCTEHLARLEADPEASASNVYLETQFEGDSDYACLNYVVDGVSVLQVSVRKETIVRQEEVSFCLSDSPILSSGSETQSSVGVETEGVKKSRKTYSTAHAIPFQHKPDFSRSSAPLKSWRRTLSVSIPSDTPKTVPQTPAWEDIARYPKPSLCNWEQGTKRSYEDAYYYRDIGTDL